MYEIQYLTGHKLDFKNIVTPLLCIYRINKFIIFSTD